MRPTAAQTSALACLLLLLAGLPTSLLLAPQPDAQAPSKAAAEAPDLSDLQVPDLSNGAAGGRGDAAAASFGAPPLRFEPNRGQAPADVAAVAAGAGATVWFDAGGMTALLQDGDLVRPVRLAFEGARSVTPTLEDATGAVSHYYGAGQRVEGVPHHERVHYADLWPGVDFVAYANAAGELEFDHVVAPGADPAQVRLRVEGAQASLQDGRLVAAAGGATFALRAPVLHQDGPAGRLPVTGAFVLDGATVSYAVGAYDPALPLVIDPVWSFSTYIGTSTTNYAYDVAIRQVTGQPSQHDVHVVGSTYATNGFLPYPPGFATTSQTGFYPSSSGAQAYAAKYRYDNLTRTATTQWFAFFTSATGNSHARGVALDGNGNVAVVGDTTATDFTTMNPVKADPFTTTPAAFDGNASSGGTDTFVLRLSPSGALQFSSYLGGSSTDSGRDVAVRADGAIVVVGGTNQCASCVVYPTHNGYQSTTGYPTSSDAFVSVIDADATPAAFVWSTLFGGGGNLDDAYAVAVDGNDVVIGGRAAGNTATAYYSVMPTTPGAFQETPPSSTTHGFVARFSSTGGLTFSTFLGGSSTTYVYDLVLDAADRPWVVGYTSAGNFPVCGTGSGAPCSASVPQNTPYSTPEVFVTQMSATGASVLWSTFLGSATSDYGYGIALDPGTGEVVVTGYTNSPFSGVRFPTTSNGPDTTQSNTDAFVTRIDPTLAGTAALRMSTFLGGTGTDTGQKVAVDVAGNIYAAGYTTSTSQFPVTPGTVQSTSGGGTDGYLTVFAKSPPKARILVTPPTGPAFLSPPTSTVSVDAGSLPTFLNQSIQGDHPIDTARNEWRLLDGTGATGSGALLETVVGTNAPSFANLPPPGVATRDVCLTVFDTDTRDPAWSSNEACVRVQWLNVPPVANNDALTIDEDDGAVDLDVLVNDSDAGGEPLTVVSVTPSASLPAALQAAFAVSPGGTGVRFTTVADHFTAPSTPLTATYTIEDGAGQQATASLALTVRPVNDPPVAVDDAVDVEEGIPTPIAVRANDHSGPDPAETLRVASATGGLGTLSVPADGTAVTYTSAPGFLGMDSFTYVVEDPSGATATATVQVRVTTQGNGPRAFLDEPSVPEDSTDNVLTVLANDWIPTTGTVVAVGTAAHGAVAVAADGLSLRYTPQPDFFGEDVFSYTISDGTLSSTANVRVQVLPVNDPPQGVADALTVMEDAPAAPVAVLANDLTAPDGPEDLAVAAVAPPTYGSASVAADGLAVLYAPAPGFSGTDRFTYTLRDAGGLTATAEATVTVQPVNDAPVAVADGPVPIIPGVPDQPVAVLGNDLDEDDPASALRVVGVQPGVGGIPTLQSGVVRFTPDDGFLGAAHFTYTIDDGRLTSLPATVTLDVALPAEPTAMLLTDAQACVGVATQLRAVAVQAGFQAERWTWTVTEQGTTVHDNVAYSDALDLVFGAAGSVAVAVSAELRSADGTTTQTLTATGTLPVLRCVPPAPDFVARIDGLFVRFEDRSTDADGTIAARQWLFGDGATSQGQAPDHTYAAPGVYAVTLQVWDDEGTAADVTRTIVVGVGGTGGAGASPAPSTDDGTPDAGADAGPGGPDAAPVNRLPTARLTAPAAVRPGETVRLDASGSRDPDGDALRFRWRQVSGPAVVLLDADTARASFRAPDAEGTLAFEVAVSDAFGAALSRGEVRVQPGDAPVAAFAVTADADSVRFEDGSLAGPGARFRWSFGDGEESDERNPSHRYALPGTYTVTLRVEDEAGASETVQVVVVGAAAGAGGPADGPTGLGPARLDADEAASAAALPGWAWGAMLAVSLATLAVAALSLLVRRR